MPPNDANRRKSRRLAHGGEAFDIAPDEAARAMEHRAFNRTLASGCFFVCMVRNAASLFIPGSASRLRLHRGFLEPRS
jgi:hypothetical protein